jgi:DNA polymerase (family 10)
VELRKIAIKNQLKLSEYGVFSDDERVAGLTESEVFEALGMGYIEPELRENTGEIEAATSRTQPELLKYDEIIGDLQMHTSWSDGKGSIMDMVLACQKMGYQYMSVTDHSGSLKIANGMNEKTIKEQMDYIDSLNHKINDFRILKGVEANIDSYGFLDVPDKLLEEMDIVVAGIHSGFKQDTHEITRRILSAMENENVDIIAHPTGRKIHGRKGYELDLERIFEASLDTGTYLEVNSQPNRLDLNDINIKMAVEHGVKLAVNTDAHTPSELHNMKLGIGTLRRGWAKKVDVINTLPLEDLLKLLN